MFYVLGISSFYHDSAAVIIKNGMLLGAIQEERFTRIKHDSSFPYNSIKYLLKTTKISINQVDAVVFYEKPFLKFERLLETYVSYSPKGLRSFNKAIPIWIKEKLFQKNILLNELKKFDKKFDKNKIFFSEHHLSHACSAFYPSGFEKSVILTLDGVGEWSTSSIAIGDNEKINIKKEIHFPHSLGLIYSAFTYFLGFKVNSGEYKVMGLAPYGEPIYKNLIMEKLIDIKKDGSFRLNQEFFNYATGFTMTNNKFSDLFGIKVRKKEDDDLKQIHMDIAASIQSVIDETMIRITRNLHDEYKINNLCLAGGVALNCVSNSKILNNNSFKKIWVQPASGDAGGALGAALSYWHIHLKNKRLIDSNFMKGAYLGPEFSNEEIEAELKNCRASFKKYNEKEIIKKTVEDLENNKAIGWFQGRMEFGPRALGARSIIADPRSKDMQKNLNIKVKFRESFRPFAPSILLEDLENWFNFKHESPYMLFVAEVMESKRKEMEGNSIKKGLEKLYHIRSEIPAVTHVDYSSRIQTVTKKNNERYFELLSQFKKSTGCPILINTSFNVRGEPIVCTPKDAYNCFMGTNLDTLVIGDFYLEKINQHKENLKDYKNLYDLD